MTELATFQFNQQNYLYEEPRHSISAVLMPIIKAEMAKYQNNQILEVGNNFYRHTSNTNHTIIDEFSTAKNKPLNLTPVQFEPPNRFDFVFSLDFFRLLADTNEIKTMEQYFCYVVIQSLRIDGIFWFATSTNCDHAVSVIKGLPTLATTLYGLRRATKYIWEQCTPHEALKVKSHKRTDGLIIGQYQRAN